MFKNFRSSFCFDMCVSNCGCCGVYILPTAAKVGSNLISVACKCFFATMVSIFIPGPFHKTVSVLFSSLVNSNEAIQRRAVILFILSPLFFLKCQSTCFHTNFVTREVCFLYSLLKGQLFVHFPYIWGIHVRHFKAHCSSAVKLMKQQWGFINPMCLQLT